MQLRQNCFKFGHQITSVFHMKMEGGWLYVLACQVWEDVHKYYLKVHISYLRAENGKGDTNIPFIH